MQKNVCEVFQALRIVRVGPLVDICDKILASQQRQVDYPHCRNYIKGSAGWCLIEMWALEMSLFCLGGLY